MAFVIVPAGQDAASGTLKVSGTAPDRKAANALMRDMPMGEYDLLQVIEVGLQVRPRTVAAASVVSRGTSTRPRAKRATPA